MDDKRGQTSIDAESLYSGLDFPVSFSVAPDGRIFFNESLSTCDSIRRVVEGVADAAPTTEAVLLLVAAVAGMLLVAYRLRKGSD